MRRRLIRIALILLLFPPFLAALAGWLVGPAYLHPIRRELTPDLIREADAPLADSPPATKTPPTSSNQRTQPNTRSRPPPNPLAKQTRTGQKPTAQNRR